MKSEIFYSQKFDVKYNTDLQPNPPYNANNLPSIQRQCFIYHFIWRLS